MKSLRYISIFCCALVSLLASFRVQSEESGLRPLPIVKEALTNKNETATVTLLEELQALIKSGAHKQFLCGNTFLSSNQAVAIDPLSYPRVIFDSVLTELLTRKNERVSAILGDLLLSEDLSQQDRKAIWFALRQLWKKDLPVVLQANDPTQDRKYLLKLNTDSFTEVEVKKGDILLRIAKKAYPNLSKWSAIEIVAFMNGFHDHESIKAGTKLRIYQYQIFKDTPASEVADK